jgi:hypothetical protein
MRLLLLPQSNEVRSYAEVQAAAGTPSAAWTWWNSVMFFLAALLALMTEWVLRKQKNLV